MQLAEVAGYLLVCEGRTDEGGVVEGAVVDGYVGVVDEKLRSVFGDSRDVEGLTDLLTEETTLVAVAV